MPRPWLLAGILALSCTGALVAQHGQVREGGQQAVAADAAVFVRAVEPHILGNDSVPDLIVSPNSGSTPSQVLDGATGALLGAGFPFGPGFFGGVRMAAGDLTGDAVADLVMAMGPGGGLVSLLNGSTITPIGTGYPFGPGFGGGVSVAVGDFDGDGRNDIVTGQASGGGAISVFNGVNYTPLLSVAPFGPGYGGGVNVAAGDFTGDGRADLLVGQASGGGIALVNGATGAVLASVAPYGAVNGVFTALGDVNADGRADLIAAPGSGNGPVLVFDFAAGVLLAAFSPYPATSTGGVRVAATDVTGDGRAEVLTVPGPGVAATLLVFDGATFANIRSYPALPAAFTGGAFIAAPAATGLQFSTPSSGTVVVGTAAAVPVRAAGSPPVNSLTVAGALPSGMTFTHSGAGGGQISGTPGAGTGGTYPLTFTASNGLTTATQAFTLTVAQPPAISSLASASFTTGAAGTFTVTTSASPSVTNITATGALPTGVTFTYNGNGTATLAGTPAPGTSGAYPLQLNASNGVGSPAIQPFTLTVNSCGAAVVVSPASGALTAGTYNSAYSQTIAATGGTGHTFAVTSGIMPAGLTLSSSGTLSGAPTATGSFTFTVTATASGGCVGSASYRLTVAPNAQAETFLNGVGNTQYSVGAGTPPTPAVVVAGSVLSNDVGPGTLVAGPASIATANGGQVTMSTDGSFLYTPAVGFAGPTDTFTYTVTDGNGVTDTAVVTINLSAVVWYVNAGAAAGDGRSNSPFNTMPAAATAAQIGHVIYVHPGAPSGATALKAGQTLQGAGEVFTLNGLTIAAGTAPTLTGTITLANAVAVRALSANAGASPSVSASALTGSETLTNVAITGGAAGLELTDLGGTLTVVGGSISGVTGAAVAVAGGTGTIEVGAAITSTTGRSVSVQNRTAGTVTFSGAISDSSTGVLLTSNTGSTIAFTGGLALSTGANNAFTATGGGTIVAQQNNTTIVNTIATTDGTALRITNTEIGSAGLTFRSISAGTSSMSAGNGIVLDTTGVGLSNGGLTVTGNGTATAFSGGTIQRKSGADGSLSSGIGAYLNSTKNPSFNYMQFFSFQNAAILGRNVSGFTLENSVIDTAGSLANGSEGPLVFGAPNPSGVNGLVGAGVIRNSNIINGVQHNAAFYNQSGAMSLTVENTTGVPGTCQIGFNSTSTGEHGLLLQLEGAAVGTAVVQDCRLRANRSAGVYATAADSASLTATVDGGEFVYTGQGANGLVLLNSGDAALTATVTDNYFSSMANSGLLVGQVSGNATATSLLRATVAGNTFDSAEGASGNGITAVLSSTAGQASRTRLLLSSNQVNQYSTSPGILVDTPDAGSTPDVNVTVTNNHVDMRENPPSSGLVGTHGVVVRARQTGVTMCANVSSNTSHWFPTTLGAGGGILGEQASSAAFLLERGGEALLTPPAAVLANNNILGPAGSSTTSVAGVLTVVENGTCLLPGTP